MRSGVAPNYSANKKLALVKKRSAFVVHANETDSSDNKGRDEADDDGANDSEDNESDDESNAGSHYDVSFIQLRGPAIQAKAARKKVLRYLTQQAMKLKSKALSAIVSKLKVGKDHFKKVRELIKDLISKLEAQAEAEADQKSWCDEEMGKATDSRDEEIGKIEDSTANIDGSESKIANLKEDIASLGKEIAELYKALNEMQELRKEEKAANEKTIADAEAGKEAVANAIEVLKEFYDNAFFLQGRFTPEGGDREGKTVDDLAPETFEGEYAGKQDQAKGIFGLLEVIQSDFERTIETVTE